MGLMLHVPQGAVIELPNDPERQAALCRKLQEYQERLTDQNLYWEDASSTEMKAIILGTLLQRGQVSYDPAEALVHCLVSEDEQAMWLERFKWAFLVIQDYCLTGGKQVSGGTGLR